MARSKPKSATALSSQERGVLNYLLSVDADAVFPDNAEEAKATKSLVRRGVLQGVPKTQGRAFPGARLKMSRADAAKLLVASQIPEPMTPFDQARAKQIWQERGAQHHLPLTAGEEAYVRWLWYQRPGAWTQADVFMQIMHGKILAPIEPEDLRAAAQAAVKADGAFSKLLSQTRDEHEDVSADDVAKAVVEISVRNGMPLSDIIARPWTAMHVYREVQDFQRRVERITADTR